MRQNLENSQPDSTIIIRVQADSACWTSPAGVAGTSISFSADCSDLRNAGFAEYQWDFGDGSPPTSWSFSRDANHVYATSGEKAVTLRIRINSTENYIQTIGEGGIDSTTHSVTIQPAPPFSVTIAGPTYIGWTDSYMWTREEGPGFGWQFRWYILPDNGPEYLAGTNWKLVRTITVPGPSFHLRLDVTNPSGQTVSDTVYVEVGTP